MVELIGKLAWDVLKAMNLPPSYTEEIKRKLTILSEQSTYALDEIQTILTSLTELETTLAAEAGNVNFALTRADVLGYEQKQRVTGILMLQVKNIQRLGVILEVTPDLSAVRNFCNILGVAFDRSYVATRVR